MEFIPKNSNYISRCKLRDLVDANSVTLWMQTPWPCGCKLRDLVDVNSMTLWMQQMKTCANMWGHTKWCREWHLLPKLRIEWVMRNWKNLKLNLKNSLQRDILNLASHHMGHPSSLFTRSTRCWGCAWIIEPSTRWPWRIDTHYLELMICLINFWKLKCLVKLTYVRGITKFKSQKGMKKRPLVAQGMVYMISWWCFLDSPMHLPHFALSWMTFFESGLMSLSSYT